MRIIGGELGGRLLPFPRHFNSRATTDVAKESLFNILDNSLDFPNLRVVDLFAGTGNISYEFASRGCPQVVAVELLGKNAGFIRKTAADYQLSQIKVIRADALKYAAKAPENYDIVFADPPYNMERMQELPDLILKSSLLKPDAWFVLEHSKFHKFHQHPSLFDYRRYGHVHFSFFALKAV